MLTGPVALTAFLSTAITVLVVPAKPGLQDTRTYMVPLTGGAEVNGDKPAGLSGDMDGMGMVRLSVDQSQREICYDFSLSDVATPLMAHIHRAPALEIGPSVVTLFTGPGGKLDDCVPWTDKQLTAILANPSNFYVNLSTTEFPDGALRGQLPG